ncbi:MAG: transcriptional regulator, MucR family [Bradyrhizobium sp.]|nr:transcriptional regulator, MucR family [Bradyrhizobium sp.]
MSDDALLRLTADIVAAHVGGNAVASSDLPRAIQLVHDALASLSRPVVDAPEAVQPAVAIRSSIKPDSLSCLECGVKQKALKRHLHRSHGLTPAAYRDKWSLPVSYPMVSPNYAKLRSELARKNGLGRKAGTKVKGGKVRTAP